MNKELIINAAPQGVEIALLEDKKLVELHSEKSDARFAVGDLYLGKVKKLIPGLNAAFVEVGFEKDAFLHYTDLSPYAKSLLKFTNQTINELTFYTNNATATDADSPANPLIFALASGPLGLTVSTNGAITWTPTEAQGPGTYVINISVTDTNPAAVNARSFSVTNSFTLTVNEVNVAPVLTVPALATMQAGRIASRSRSLFKMIMPTFDSQS